jgi:hypothetical protein
MATHVHPGQDVPRSSARPPRNDVAIAAAEMIVAAQVWELSSTFA